MFSAGPLKNIKEIPDFDEYRTRSLGRFFDLLFYKLTLKFI